MHARSVPHNPLQALLPRASDGCIQCPDAPVCYCAADETCLQIYRTCTACPSFTCQKNTDSSSAPKGVSGGAVAGAVVGVLILLIAVVGVFMWHRRRVRLARNNESPLEPKELPASASDVLNRPDPNEKAQQQQQRQQPPSPPQNTFRVFPSSQTNINLDPEAQMHGAYGSLHPPENPFADAQSIQTTSTGSQCTNVIPIALVPRVTGGVSSSGSSGGLDLNLAHLNVSKDSVPPQGSQSAVSGPSRQSYMSTATGATDFLNEAPIISTPTHRQVLGVARPEVIQAPGSAPSSVPVTPMTGDSLRVQLSKRPSMRSPLATTSFGPSDVSSGNSEEGRTNPFGDEHSPVPTMPAMPAWATQNPNEDHNRPISMQTMATNVGTIIADIGSATRVQLGFSPNSAGSTPMQSPSSAPRVLHRMVSGRLITPRASPPGSGSQIQGTLQEQQERAIALAQLKAREQNGELHRRVSNGSVASAASTRADSILASFPFVPPSPISSLPTRASRSPLAAEGYNSFGVEPDSPTRRAAMMQMPPSPLDPLHPPNRKTLGMSTGSQLSTASSGLGAFDFQMENSPAPPPPSAFGNRASGQQRASLDTLALTKDLSSYPLGFDDATAGRHATERR